jgi:hypothetical protein
MMSRAIGQTWRSSSSRARPRCVERPAEVDVHPDRRGVAAPPLVRQVARALAAVVADERSPSRSGARRARGSAPGLRNASRYCGMPARDIVESLQSCLCMSPSAFVRVASRSGSFQMQCSLWKMKPRRAELADDVAAEILEADEAVALLHRRHVHAVDGDDPAWLRHTEQLVDHDPEVLPELAVGAAISEIALRRAVDVQRQIRRREHRQVRAARRQRRRTSTQSPL